MRWWTWALNTPTLAPVELSKLGPWLIGFRRVELWRVHLFLSRPPFLLALRSYTTLNFLEYANMSKEGHCVIRGNCGSKSIFGQQLPCPDDGPARDVCNSSLSWTTIAHSDTDTARKRRCSFSTCRCMWWRICRSSCLLLERAGWNTSGSIRHCRELPFVVPGV